MDHEDEIQIKEKLEELTNNNKKLIDESNKQVFINKIISDQINNITTHIRKQQESIETYLNTYNQKLVVKVQTIETEVRLMQYMYQINHDILILRNHDIEQI